MIDEGYSIQMFHKTEELIEKRKKNKKFKSEWRDKKPDSSAKDDFCIKLISSQR